MAVHVIAITLSCLVAPYILPERTRSRSFGGPGGSGGKVIAVIDFGKGKQGNKRQNQ